jgi:LacI family transcriptional regulator
MISRSSRRKRRRNVLLALGWNTFEFNLGVAEYAKKANWILNDIMCHSGEIPSRWEGDGIIAHVNSSNERPLISLLRRARVPVVNLGAFTSSLIAARVLPDNAGIGQMAAEHLLGRGFEHFAYYRLSASPVVMERMEGYRATVKAAGKHFHELDCSPIMAGAKARPRGGNAYLLPRLAVMIKRLSKPLAVMSQYDGEANDVTRACFSAGLRVPDDVAVIGVDNDRVYSQLGPVPLTSVDSNRRLAAYRAAEMLDRILDGERWHEKTVRIAPEGVVVRESTDILAVEDLHVSKALRFIWDNFTKDITVDDVVRHSGISRRGLYSRFEGMVGHPIYEELMRQRLDRAKQLLRETDEKLQFIADECGLGDAERLSKSFKRYCGVSPVEYRSEHRI